MDDIAKLFKTEFSGGAGCGNKAINKIVAVIVIGGVVVVNAVVGEVKVAVWRVDDDVEIA